ncbi:MAG: rRNA maturation RNase YbeY [Pseudooceanicola sp.]|nr:rRNA maturation RNase YbeY [Pseudooceanicola sp.]
MTLDLLVEAAGWQALDLNALAVRAVSVSLAHLGLDPYACEIALLATDDAHIATLNAEFRGKPTPTNVLSWPADDLAAEEPGAPPYPPEPDPDGTFPLGDIALAWETCNREATEQGKSPSDHVTHLVVHGLLHLLGYDHETDPDAALMETLEVTILGKLGLPDPYAIDDGP